MTVEEIIKSIGSQAEVGRKIGVSQQAISLWCSENDIPPHRREVIYSLWKKAMKPTVSELMFLKGVYNS